MHARALARLCWVPSCGDCEGLGSWLCVPALYPRCYGSCAVVLALLRPAVPLAVWAALCSAACSSVVLASRDAVDSCPPAVTVR